LNRSGIAAHVKDPASARIITQLSKLMPVSIRRQMQHAEAKLGALSERTLNHGFSMSFSENCIQTPRLTE
jgi:hypothetical protein